jgi:hypothetical protein
MRRMSLLVVLALLALAGCRTSPAPSGSSAGSGGSAGPGGSVSPGGSASPAGSTGSPGPAGSVGPASPAGPAGTGVLVQFRRQGGFAGLSDYLVVREDGGYTLERRRPAVTKTGRLSAADLAELRKVLTDADFAHMPRVQPARGNDLFTYQVIYGDVEVAAMDGGMVEPLKPVVGTLSGLVARYS